MCSSWRTNSAAAADKAPRPGAEVFCPGHLHVAPCLCLVESGGLAEGVERQLDTAGTRTCAGRSSPGQPSPPCTPDPAFATSTGAPTRSPKTGCSRLPADRPVTPAAGQAGNDATRRTEHAPTAQVHPDRGDTRVITALFSFMRLRNDHPCMGLAAPEHQHSRNGEQTSLRGRTGVRRTCKTAMIAAITPASVPTTVNTTPDTALLYERDESTIDRPRCLSMQHPAAIMLSPWNWRAISGM